MRQVWTTLGFKTLVHYSIILTIQLSFLVFSLRLKVMRATRRISIRHSDYPRLSNLADLDCAAVIKWAGRRAAALVTVVRVHTKILLVLLFFLGSRYLMGGGSEHHVSIQPGWRDEAGASRQFITDPWVGASDTLKAGNVSLSWGM
jgi:hypothetical protein